MNEYTFLDCMIACLCRSDAFSYETLHKLCEELEEAYKDGRLDTDNNFAPAELLLCSIYPSEFDF